MQPGSSRANPLRLKASASSVPPGIALVSRSRASAIDARLLALPRAGRGAGALRDVLLIRHGKAPPLMTHNALYAVWWRLQRYWPDKEVTDMADVHPDVLWALMRERQRDLEKELATRARLRQARPATAWRCRPALLAVRACLRALGLRLQARQKP
jgi:hypothetical protein